MKDHVWWDIPGWDGVSFRDRAEAAGRDDVCPASQPHEAGRALVSWFWGVRGFLSGYDQAVTPDLVAQWAEWSGVSLSRRDQGIMYAMDRAFRQTMPKAISDHENRRKNQEAR